MSSEFLNSLTEKQRATLKKLLEMDEKTFERLEKVAKNDERMEWLWAGIRQLAAGVAIIVGAIVLLFEQIKAFFRGLVQ